MPVRKYRRKTFRRAKRAVSTSYSRRRVKRTYRRVGRRNYRRSSRLTRTFIKSTRSGPFSDACYAKLKYTQINAFASGTTPGYARQVWSGNSCFDPDFTGTGTQPFGFDQYCTANGPYFYYRVVGSAIKVTIIPYDDVGTTPGAKTGALQVAIIPSLANTDLVTATGSTDINELGTCAAYGRQKLMDLNWGSLKDHTISSYMRTGKLEGLSKQCIYTDINYAAAYNGNPTNRWYWQFYVSNPFIGDVSVKCYCRTELTYYVKFEHKANIPMS